MLGSTASIHGEAVFNTKRIRELEDRVRQLEDDLLGMDELLQAMCEADTVVEFVPCQEFSDSIKRKMN